jgi:hypothetical protein
MAVRKNPSIYDDRGTIGSSDELDEYGVWVKVAPREHGDAEEEFPDFSADLDPGIPPEEPAASLEDVSDDISDFIDDTDTDAADLEALRAEIQFPEEDAADLLEGLPLPDLDDLSDLPEEIPPPLEAGAEKPDLSTQLLMKIADELAFIKGELSGLKDEIAVIRSEKPDGNADEDGDGFFDEEDDDKIALTGDELNNILHTADFTEETGADAGENPEDDFIALETGETVDITPLNEDIVDTHEEAPGSDDIPPDAIADLEARDTDDLKDLRENGVEPMTSPPEDTSYLEEDTPPAEEHLFEEVSFDELADGGESIDLSTIEDAEDSADPDDLDIGLSSLPDITLDDVPAAEPDSGMAIPSGIKNELIHILVYMDKLLESLPEEKIEEFAQSEHYVTYKKLFDELGIE